MKILRVIGLGLFIIMVRFLVPQIFAGFQNVLLTFFDTLEFALVTSKGAVQTGSAASAFMPAHIPSVNSAF
jgi:hypothetical protein